MIGRLVDKALFEILVLAVQAVVVDSALLMLGRAVLDRMLFEIFVLVVQVVVDNLHFYHRSKAVQGKQGVLPENLKYDFF